MAPTGGARAERAAATQTALKEAALRLFDRDGYLNTKITDITAEAGRAAGSFYNHFASKEELLESLLADLFAAGDEAVAGHPPDHDLSDRSQLRWHIAVFIAAFRRYRPVFVAIQQAAMVDARFAARLAAMLAEQQQPLREHLEYLRDRGYRLPGEPDAVALAMSGMWTQFAQARTEYLGRPIDDDETVETLTDLTLGGIAGGPPR